MYDTIQIHGMSPNDTDYAEPVTLSDGSKVQLIREHTDEGGNLAVKVNELTARYTTDEVLAAGNGSQLLGEIMLYKAVVDAQGRGAFDHHEPRPFPITPVA
jgi:hypothetical protein